MGWLKHHDFSKHLFFSSQTLLLRENTSQTTLLQIIVDNVKILKLDKIKSAKLKNALKVAKDYM